MVNSCIVNGCKRESYPGCGISYFRLPKDTNLRAEWLKFLQVKPSPHLTVCSMHFKPDELNISLYRCTLKPGAVPSIFPKAEVSVPVKTFPQPIIEKDPLKLEDDDYDDDNEMSSSVLPHDTEQSSSNEEEQILIKEEENDHDFENAIPSSMLLPQNTEGTPAIEIDSNNDCNNDFSALLDHDYESNTSSSPLHPIVTPKTTDQDLPKMIISPLPSRCVSSMPVKTANAHQNSPTMLIGPLPSSHLHSNQVKDKTALQYNNKSRATQKTIQDLQQKVKILKQRLKRRDFKIKSLNNKVNSLKKNLTLVR